MEKEKNIWLKYNEEDLVRLEDLNAGYLQFLNTGKTERECVAEIVRQAKAAGYRELSEVKGKLKT